MKKKHELTRREMLGVMAASTLGAAIPPREMRIAFNTTRDKNKEIARSLLQAWNDRGESYMPADLVSPKLVTHYPHPHGKVAHGRGNGKYDAVLPSKGFQDQRFKEEVLIADAEHVFIGWKLTGVHAGTLYGKAATGKTVTTYGSDIIRVVDGQIIEHVTYNAKARVQALARLGLLNREMGRFLVAKGLLGRNHVTGRVNPKEVLELYNYLALL